MKLSDYNQHLASQECQRLVDEQNGVLGVVLASIDGFDLASAVTRSLDPVRIAAMASSISAIGSVVSQESTIGASESITVKTANGFVVITTVKIENADCILNVVASDSAILAQISYHCNDMRKRLESM